MIFGDPMDSQPTAMANLGREATLLWGLGFCLSFPLVSWLSFWRGNNLLNGLVGSSHGGLGSGKATLFDHVEALMSMTILVGILFGVLLLLNVMRGQKVPVAAILFSTGLIVVPLAGLSLYGFGLSFLGKAIKSRDAMEVIGYIGSFVMLLSVSSAFLLTFATLTSVIGYTRKVAFWLVPGVLMVTFVVFTWISKLTGEISNLGT